ncbi:MAG: DUF4328 domain-containing protein [Acidimicrobiia bacterium]
MTETGRAAGWYPDPWGTDDERYFDGRAWSRQTRVVGSDDAVVQYDHTEPTGSAVAAPGGSTGAPAPGALGAPPATSPPAGPPGPPPDAAPGAAPAGWHRDPWGLAAMRWWDGDQWTGYVSGPPADRVGTANVTGERSLAAWLRPALVVGGLAQAVALVTSVDQAQWVVDHWDALTRPSGPVPQMPASTATSLAQLATIVGLVVAVLFLVWFHRAASTAWSSGLPARHSPLVATLSFIIPILNLWWPYQSALDMVPASDPGRAVIRWWWIAWLTATLCGLLVYPTAAVYNEVTARVVASIGAVAMIVAALGARAVVEYVTSTHERLGNATAAT